MEIESRLTVSLLLLFTILKYHCAFLYGIAGIGNLRSLKDDTLLIIDNFNVTATQDSFLSVVLKYRCGFYLRQEVNLMDIAFCS